MPLLRSKVTYPVPEPCILGSGSTWCEPSQLGRAGLVNSADEGHHLYTLLLPVVKAVSLGTSKGTLETEACSSAHPPDWLLTPHPSVPSFSYLDFKAEGLVVCLLQSQHLPAEDTGVEITRSQESMEELAMVVHICNPGT